MARDRTRGREERRRAEAEAGRRRARGWYVRALFLLAFAVLLAVVNLPYALPPGVIGLYCLLQGVQETRAAD